MEKQNLLANNLNLDKNIFIPNTTYNNQFGIIYKNNQRFIHNFNYGNNGTVTTIGNNLFIGSNAGNFTMGSSATQIFHSSYNTGIGVNALSNISTGYNNTAIGYNASQFLSTGYDNVTIGSTCGQNITTGYNNTIIGRSALFLATSAYNNTAIGFAALYNIINSMDNIAIGVSSFYSLSSGNYNIAIGDHAGRFILGNIDLNTANNSIFIGSESKALNNNNTNEIVIGHQAIGNGSNTITLGNTNIIKTYLRGILQLNGLNTSPSSSSDTGTTGEIRFTTDYIYVCTGTNTWKRAALSTW